MTDGRRPVPPQFQRTAILLGEQGVERLAASHVFLAGLGGVGSWCAEALGRAGVGRLTLVDHDVVAVSNINRQLPALLSTVGHPKVEVLAERLGQINPACEVTVDQRFIQPDNVDSLLPGEVDWVVDCIDSLNCKLALIAAARQRGLGVAASMGAGNRLDPARIHLADISQTRVCALARAVRKGLRRRGIEDGVLCVFSDEEAHPPGPMEATGLGRARVVNGTISYLPALFGMMLAGAVIRQMLGQGRTEAGLRD